MPVVTNNRISYGYNEGQADWGVKTNNSLRALAYVGVTIAVRNIDVNTPPSSPVHGDRYIVGASATGLWSGFAEHSIAVWGYDEATGNTPAVSATPSWQQFTPDVGSLVYDQQNSRVLFYDGASWSELQNSAVSIRVDSTLRGNGNTMALGVANPFTDADERKLDGIADNATVDQSATQIRNLLQGLSGSSRLSNTAIQPSRSLVSDSFSIRVNTHIPSTATRPYGVKVGSYQLGDDYHYAWTNSTSARQDSIRPFTIMVSYYIEMNNPSSGTSRQNVWLSIVDSSVSSPDILIRMVWERNRWAYRGWFASNSRTLRSESNDLAVVESGSPIRIGLSGNVYLRAGLAGTVRRCHVTATLIPIAALY